MPRPSQEPRRGTILGQTFTTPLTGSITTPGNGRGSANLRLDLQPINLNLVGLEIKTSGISLNVTAQNRGGQLGALIGGQLKNALASVENIPSAQATASLSATLSKRATSRLDQQVPGPGARPALKSFTPCRGPVARNSTSRSGAAV